jgi:hypothetical protein
MFILLPLGTFLHELILQNVGTSRSADWYTAAK